MDFYNSFLFFGLAFVLSLPAVALGLAERPIRRWTLAASLVMVVTYGLWHLAEGFWLAVAMGWFLTLARTHLWFRRRYGKTAPGRSATPARPAWWVDAERKAAVALALVPLAVVKVAGPLHWTVPHIGIIGFLGVSYVTFRLVQVVVETSDGLVTELPLPQTLSYLIFFPTLSSGPIDRSRRFAVDAATTWTRAEYLQLLKTSIRRFVLGFGYKFVGASLCAAWLASLPRGASIAAMYAYGGQLFFDFAGYSLMAVAVGMVFGVRTPMNFRLPFVAESIKDFWNRWHITLSFWLRDYVYTRLLMALMKRTRLGHDLANWIALFVNMLLMGFWHGLEAQYVAYGAFHGVLMVANEVWEKRLPYHARWQGRTWYRLLGIVVTAHLVLFGFLIFSGRLAA